MNEATFESHLASALQRLFPGLLVTQIETQNIIALRLGYQAFAVDGLSSLAHGRGDVILHLSHKPTLMLELKAPGIELTSEDLKQDLSSVRLHEPMIPLVVVTNGNTTHIYSTFDGTPLIGNDRF